MQCERFTSLSLGLFNQSSGKAGCDRGYRVVDRAIGSDLPVDRWVLFLAAVPGTSSRGNRRAGLLPDLPPSGRRCRHSRCLKRQRILSPGSNGTCVGCRPGRGE